MQLYVCIHILVVFIMRYFLSSVHIYILTSSDPREYSVSHVIQKYLVSFRTFLDNSDEHLPQDFSEVFYHPLHWLFCIPSSCFFLLEWVSKVDCCKSITRELVLVKYCYILKRVYLNKCVINILILKRHRSIF